MLEIFFFFSELLKPASLQSRAISMTDSFSGKKAYLVEKHFKKNIIKQNHKKL